MTSISQANLLALARTCEAKGDSEGAIANLEEALRSGFDNAVGAELAKVYRLNGQEDQAYAVLKTAPDLFSDQALFEEYQQTLKANHYLIEALQVKHLTGGQLEIPVEAASLAQQQEIMQDFRKAAVVTNVHYQSLFKLDLPSYLPFVQSLLLDPSQGFALRLALCEDLVKLGIDQKISVLTLGEIKAFLPSTASLLRQDPVYREAIGSVADKLRRRPSELPLYLNEANLALGSLYPFITDYVSNPDSFAKALLSYLQKQGGFEYQDLLDRIYQKNAASFE